MKTQIENYTFDKTAKTITFDDYSVIDLESILHIQNVTRGVTLFSGFDTAKLGTVTGTSNVLTLLVDTAVTSPMNNADKLLIYYDDENAITPVNLVRPLSAVLQGGLQNEYDSALALPGVRPDSWQAPPIIIQSTTAQTLFAAHGSLRRYVTDITISTDGGAACDVLIQDDSGTPVVLDRVQFGVVAQTITLRYVTPKKTTAAKALMIKPSNATPKIMVSASGYTYA